MRSTTLAFAGSPAFQSAPAIAGGRCLLDAAGTLTKRLVSIRARHCWRAMLRPGQPCRCSADSFNPRPPLLAGDARLGTPHWSRGVVSIRARHCWRAMRLAHGSRVPFSLVSIRARHCWRAMRSARRTGRFSARFQSAPAIAGGRCSEEKHHDLPSHRFNPRPPLLAGDASAATPSPAKRCCFNPRPPLLAGDA